jgi:hypothetical protein
MCGRSHVSAMKTCDLGVLRRVVNKGVKGQILQVCNELSTTIVNRQEEGTFSVTGTMSLI